MFVLQRRNNITSGVDNVGCDLHSTVQYSRLQIEAVKLRVKGYSETQIADALGVRYQSVHRALKAFEKVAPIIRRDMIELGKVRYWEKARIARLRTDIGADQLAKAKMKQSEFISKGYWPYAPPFGYVKQRDKIEFDLDPEKAKTVSRIFEGRIEGKSTVQLARETGLDSYAILFILKNPFYYGVVKLKDRLIPGKHPPIVSKEIWDRAQMPGDYPLRRQRKAPYGYRWVAGELRKEPEKSEQICSIFVLRSRRESLRKISKSTGLSIGLVRHIIHNAIYRGVTPEGKPMPSSFEPFVDSDLWWAANRVHNQTVKELIEDRRDRKRLDENMILTCLRRAPLSTKELLRETRLSQYRIVYLTLGLKRRGIIEKPGNKRGKWVIRETVTKAD